VLLTLAALAVVLGPLIFVHEMGHFLAAKAVGVQVLRFSIGFGRPLLRRRRGETEYWLSWIPLGGYVKLATLEEEGPAGALEGGAAAVPIDPARVIESKSVPARLVVMLAGVTMNLVLAFAIYAGVAATVGSPQLATTQLDSVTASALPPGAEGLATLRHGDRIVRLNGDTVRTWNDLIERIVSGGTDLDFAVAGRAEALRVHLRDGSPRARQQLAQALVRLEPPRLGLLEPGRPAIRAGLRPGDLIVRANGDTIRSWNDVLHAVWNSPGKPIRFDVRRDTAVLGITVTPEPRTETDTTSPRPHVYGVIGAGQDPPTIHVRESLGQALVTGYEETITRVRVVLGFLKGLALGQLSPRDVGGPILVGQISGQVARLGIDWFLTFVAFFSVNLAVLNLVPIPILDGGQVLFLLIEAVRRKPLSVELRTRLSQIGFLVVLGLMALALANDVLRILPR
jgi:regulator of sigma E protease